MFILPYPSNTVNMYLQYTYHMAIILIGKSFTIQIRYMFVEIFEFISVFIFVIFNIE